MAKPGAKFLYWLYEDRLLRKLKAAQVVPKHLGLIMDGNRRFARAGGQDIKAGHKAGVQKSFEVLDWCDQLGITMVTLWAFSTENFNRDPAEVQYMFKLFEDALRSLESDPRMTERQIKFVMIGERERFPEALLSAITDLENKTAKHEGLVLQIAMAYGGRAEIVTAVKELVSEGQAQGLAGDKLVESISEESIGRYLYTAGQPDPDFIIRTSGEFRMSGFMIWQAAYSELYFLDVYWPAFRRVDFLRAIRDFQGRKRRFGK